jgi:hypothetical protein
MIPDNRLQQLFNRRNHYEELQWMRHHDYTEGWAILDGSLVVYDVDNPPQWLPLPTVRSLGGQEEFG